MHDQHLALYPRLDLHQPGNARELAVDARLLEDTFPIDSNGKDVLQNGCDTQGHGFVELLPELGGEPRRSREVPRRQAITDFYRRPALPDAGRLFSG